MPYISYQGTPTGSVNAFFQGIALRADEGIRATIVYLPVLKFQLVLIAKAQEEKLVLHVTTVTDTDVLKKKRSLKLKYLPVLIICQKCDYQEKVIAA